MSAHAVTLQLEAPLYDHFKRRAEQGRRSVEAEILDVVRSAASPTGQQLPPELAEEISALTDLDDQALWQTARSHLPREAARRLETLNSRQKSEGLSEQEKDELSRTLYQYDRYMLLRAHAAKLLKERGHDVTEILAGR